MGLTDCSARLPYSVDSEGLGRTLPPLQLFDLVRWECSPSYHKLETEEKNILTWYFTKFLIKYKYKFLIKYCEKLESCIDTQSYD